MDNVRVNPDFTPKRRETKIILPCILLLLFVALSIMVMKHTVDPLDSAVEELVRIYTFSSLAKIFVVVTQFGTAAVLVPLTLVITGYFLIVLKQNKQPLLLIISLVGALLLEVTLKQIFLRPRPHIRHLITATGYSFPSGHSLCSAAFYGMFGYLLYSELKHRNKPVWYIPIVTIVVITLIGVSRIYLGVHYPTDVIGGFLIGTCWAITVSNWINLGYKIKDRKQSSNSLSN